MADSAAGARPSMAGPLAAAAAFVVAMGAVMGDLDWQSLRRTLVAAATVLFLLGGVLSVKRGLEEPTERAGWLLIAAGRFLLAMLAVWVTVPSDVPVFPQIGLGVFAHFLTAVGLFSWPWRRAPHVPKVPHVLGSLLFIGSVGVLLWLSGTWAAGMHEDFNRAAMLSYGIHAALMGGAGLYLVSEVPGRLRGPLGWILVSGICSALVLALLQRFFNGAPVWPPLSAVLLVGPIGYVFAAWCGLPAEPASHERVSPGWSLLLYAPYAVVGITLGTAQMHRRGQLAGPALAFLALTTVLLARQFVLLEELRQSHDMLEARVRERTRDLEVMQATAMRTERTNLTATLGAGLAHDLNNALTVILANAKALEANSEGRPEAELAADLAAAAQRAASLTGRLMRFARQAREEAPALVDLRECTLAIGGLLRAFLGRRIELVMDLDAGKVLAPSSRARYEQVLVNLVTNARDALSEGGTITIRVRRLRASPGEGEGRGAELTVEDTGPGMGEEVLSHLFEPFFTTKGEGSGTGLGLVSVKATVEQDGGAVAVESAPGQGSKFRVTWPAPAVGVMRVASLEAPPGARLPSDPLPHPSR